MDPSSMPNLAGAFDNARNSQPALEWQYGERTNDMVKKLAKACVLSGLQAIQNYLAAGDEASVALAGVIHTTYIAVEHDLIRIATTVVVREGMIDEDAKIVAAQAGTKTYPNGMQMICLYVSHGWIDKALATGSNETNSDVLALLAGVALPAILMLEDRFFSFSATPPDELDPDSPPESTFSIDTNMPGDVIQNAGRLIRAVVEGMQKPPQTDQPETDSSNT